MKRGSAYWINLEPSSPPERGKVRPGIVVSNSIQNQRLDSVVIVPLSSRAPEIWPLRFRLELPGMKASYAVIPGIRRVSKSRLEDFIAETAAEAMARIGNALAIYLGDGSRPPAAASRVSGGRRGRALEATIPAG